MQCLLSVVSNLYGPLKQKLELSWTITIKIALRDNLLNLLHIEKICVLLLLLLAMCISYSTLSGNSWGSISWTNSSPIDHKKRQRMDHPQHKQEVIKGNLFNSKTTQDRISQGLVDHLWSPTTGWEPVLLIMVLFVLYHLGRGKKTRKTFANIYF